MIEHEKMLKDSLTIQIIGKKNNGEIKFPYKNLNIDALDYYIETFKKIFVKILNEELKEDEKIEKLGEKYETFSGNYREFKKLDEYGGKVLANKIDEIIDVVNELNRRER